MFIYHHPQTHLGNMATNFDSMNATTIAIDVSKRLNKINDELSVRFDNINIMLAEADVNIGPITNAYIDELDLLESHPDLSAIEQRYHYNVTQKMKNAIEQKKKTTSMVIHKITDMESWVFGILTSFDAWAIKSHETASEIDRYKEHLFKTQDIVDHIRKQYQTLLTALDEFHEACG
jgi:hypothetical protein